MVWGEIVWFQIMNLMVWVASGVGQSAEVTTQLYRFQTVTSLNSHMMMK